MSTSVSGTVVTGMPRTFVPFRRALRVFIPAPRGRPGRRRGRRASEFAPVATLDGVADLREPWTLAGHELPNRLVLAPLAGIGNWFVRLQARRYGAGIAISEMVSSF